MRAIVCAVIAFCTFSVSGQELQSVLVQPSVVSAQEHAEHLARTGTFGHCSRRGGGYEGIGLSSVSADDAMRRSCYWGQRRVREVGTAWSPVRRAWIAVVRYH